MKNLGIELSFTEELVMNVSTWGYESEYGARPLRRTVQSKVEDFLADELLNGRIVVGDNVVCDYVEKKIVITKQFESLQK